MRGIPKINLIIFVMLCALLVCLASCNMFKDDGAQYKQDGEDSLQQTTLEESTVEISAVEGIFSLYPSMKATLDNGCSVKPDSIQWVFMWSAPDDAEKFHLIAKHAEHSFPVVDDDEVSDTFYVYLADEAHHLELNGWNWKVRSMVDDKWEDWSDLTAFKLESVNHDCDTGNGMSPPDDTFDLPADDISSEIQVCPECPYVVRGNSLEWIMNWQGSVIDPNDKVADVELVCQHAKEQLPDRPEVGEEIVLTEKQHALLIALIQASIENGALSKDEVYQEVADMTDLAVAEAFQQ